MLRLALFVALAALACVPREAEATTLASLICSVVCEENTDPRLCRQTCRKALKHEEDSIDLQSRSLGPSRARRDQQWIISPDEFYSKEFRSGRW